MIGVVHAVKKVPVMAKMNVYGHIEIFQSCQ